MRAAGAVFLALALCSCGRDQKAVSTREEEAVLAMLSAVHQDCGKIAEGVQGAWKASMEQGMPLDLSVASYYSEEGGADAAGAKAGLVVIKDRVSHLKTTPPEVKSTLLDLYSSQVRLCELAFDPGDFTYATYSSQLGTLGSEIVGARAKLEVLLPPTKDPATLLTQYRAAFNFAKNAYQQKQAAERRARRPQPQEAPQQQPPVQIVEDLEPASPVLPLPAEAPAAETAHAVQAAQPVTAIHVRARDESVPLLPSLVEWHEDYQEASAPARTALVRVADRLRAGELPSADCQALSALAREAFPALKAPDTRIAGSLREAYQAMVELGDACASGKQIGAMGLLELTERKIDNAEGVLQRKGLER